LEKADIEAAKREKEVDIKHGTKEFIHLDEVIAGTRGENAGIQKQLDAVNAYLQNIKVQCTLEPDSYNQKQESRADEIAGLKNALNTLEGRTSFLQQSTHRLRGHRP